METQLHFQQISDRFQCIFSILVHWVWIKRKVFRHVNNIAAYFKRYLDITWYSPGNGHHRRMVVRASNLKVSNPGGPGGAKEVWDSAPSSSDPHLAYLACSACRMTAFVTVVLLGNYCSSASGNLKWGLTILDGEMSCQGLVEVDRKA